MELKLTCFAAFPAASTSTSSTSTTATSQQPSVSLAQPPPQPQPSANNSSAQSAGGFADFANFDSFTNNSSSSQQSTAANTNPMEQSPFHVNGLTQQNGGSTPGAGGAKPLTPSASHFGIQPLQRWFFYLIFVKDNCGCGSALHHKINV